MKINQVNKPIMCDTVLCNQKAKFELELNSFKGNNFLCESCFNKLKNLLKRTTNKNEEN